MIETGARLWLLAAPLLATAPAYYLATRSASETSWFDELWWRYAVWATQRAGPTAVKLAQWASSRNDRFPERFCNEFSQLQDRAGTHSWRHTESALDAAISGWRSRLDLDRNPIGAGCVAQVYRATLIPSGDRVAVKVVHPESRARIKTDLELLRCVARCVEWLAPVTRWFSLAEAVDEFGKTLERQMDMRREANNLDRLVANFSRDPRVTFPKPRHDLCSEDVLVEDLVEGTPIRDFIECVERWGCTDEVARRAISRIGVDAVCKMIFEDNLLHGDLHPGNILVLSARPPQVCFLDAGIVVELGRREHAHFVNVLAALMRHDGVQAAKLLIGGGQALDDEDNLLGFSNAEEARRAKETFVAMLADITSRTEDEAFFEKISDYATLIFKTAEECHIRLQGYFVSTAIAIRVMEGVANALDRDVQIGKLAIPWIVKSEIKRAMELQRD
ncbi:ABC1 family-domain-containing protein [Pelagophyceae sp. CCMP2097]|nr:ABC1 family-domain-containing protein [Pelagophyceae sp. CCMP2097]